MLRIIGWKIVLSEKNRCTIGMYKLNYLYELFTLAKRQRLDRAVDTYYQEYVTVMYS